MPKRRYSPKHNRRFKKAKRRGRRGIGQTTNGKVTDVCAPVWAVAIIGGLAAYGTFKAMGR